MRREFLPSILTILFTMAVGPGSAWAQSDKAAAQSIGLLGTWATDCTKPATPTNWFIRYEANTDGHLQALYDNGDKGGPLLAIVESIHVQSPTTVATRLRYQDPRWGKSSDGGMFDMILELKDNHKQTVHSVRVNGGVLIEDRRNLLSGKAADIQEKCLARPVT